MKKISVPFRMFFAMCISMISTVALYFLYDFSGFAPYKYLGQIFFAISIQFVIMFIIAPIISMTFKRKYDYENIWFREKKFEQKLYRSIKIRRWKERVISYDRNMLKINENSLEIIAQNMCHNEVVHECIAIAGFLPLLFSFCGVNVFILLISSVASAFVHLSFAIVQRYNRPIVLRLINKTFHNS